MGALDEWFRKRGMHEVEPSTKCPSCSIYTSLGKSFTTYGGSKQRVFILAEVWEVTSHFQKRQIFQIGYNTDINSELIRLV